MSPTTAPRRRARAALGWALALLVAACGGDQQPTAPGPAPAVAAPAPANARTGAPAADIEPLFDWAEHRYAQLFPAGPATQPLTVDGRTYTVRFYSDTGNILGVAADGGVWGHGPFTTGALTAFGHLDDYTCLTSPGRCQPTATSCRTVLQTGFTGDLNATYESAGGGDGGGDGADGGSAGVGGSEGKVLGGRLKVYRLSDGALLAQGLTDSQQGLTTLRWCRSDLPVMLEMQGAPGASYFDEGLNTMVDFPLTQKLRALVDRFDENVGVSAQTEAAYLYVMNQWQSDPQAIANGRRPLVTDGVPVGLSGAQVKQVNALMLEELNRRLTDRLQQASMKALATPIDERSDRNALPPNRYGRQAAMTGGFARMARGFNGDTPTPALTFARQFALDFTDGRIDDYALDGRPAGSAGQATYRGTEAGLNWTVGQGLIGQQFGQDSTRLDGEPYVSAEYVWLGFSPTCTQAWGQTRIAHYYLSVIGTLTAVESRAPPGGCIWDPGFTTSSRLNVLTGIRKLVGQIGDRAYAIGLDGAVHGWGRNGCGRVGNGVIGNTVTTEPMRITGLPSVVDVAIANGINVALTRDGEVYTWGYNAQDLAGLGTQLTDPLCTEDQQFNLVFTGLTPFRVIATPRRVPGLAQIVAISAGGSTVNAVRADGRVFQWGNVANAAGRTIQSASPVEVVSVTQPRKVVTGSGMSFAIVAGGRVATWWDWPQEIFEQPAASLRQPQILPALDDVVDIATDPLGSTLALRGDGSLWFWGQWYAGENATLTLKPRLANLPVRRIDGQPASGLPRIVRLSVVANFVSAIGADNLTYRLIPGRTERDFFWDAGGAYNNLPSPF